MRLLQEFDQNKYKLLPKHVVIDPKTKEKIKVRQKALAPLLIEMEKVYKQANLVQDFHFFKKFHIILSKADDKELGKLTDIEKICAAKYNSVPIKEIFVHLYNIQALIIKYKIDKNTEGYSEAINFIYSVARDQKFHFKIEQCCIRDAVDFVDDEIKEAKAEGKLLPKMPDAETQLLYKIICHNIDQLAEAYEKKHFPSGGQKKLL